MPEYPCRFRLIIAAAFLFFIMGNSVPAQQVTINGYLTDVLGGPVAGADLRLVRAGFSAVSGDAGNFQIIGTLGVVSDRVDAGSQGIRITGDRIFFKLDSENKVVIDLFDLSGKRMNRFAEGVFGKGEHSVFFAPPAQTSEVGILGVAIGGENFYCKVIGAPGSIYFSEARGLLKPSADPVDTIEVTAAGYITKYVPIASFTGVVNIAIKRQFSDAELTYADYTPAPSDIAISRSQYLEGLHGFWLGESIANWTGLITEMDRVGMPRTGPFYTDDDWGGPDYPTMWGGGGLSATIDFLFTDTGTPWGADDDTDIEYIYQHLLDQHNTSMLTGEQIRDGWLNHIYDQNQVTPYGMDDDPTAGYQNYIWVSNQTAYDLMRDLDMVPPITGTPRNNPDCLMIDAQLTTEIFGFFAPARPDIGLQMAQLPIQTTACEDAELISEFYVTMYSLAAYVNHIEAHRNKTLKEKVFWMAEQAAAGIPTASFVSKMYAFVKSEYDANPDKDNWEATRDAVYNRYQGYGNSIQSADGYFYSGYGNAQSNTGHFDAGINFAASLISLFYGEGDMPRTIRIGALVGWDSDNPTATWGGLYGMMLGKNGVAQAFGKNNLSDTFWIHRTRRNFPDRTPAAEGEDTFPMMAERGIYIIDRVVMEEMGGGVDLAKDVWYVPDRSGAAE